ncbi:Protein DGCR6 [Microtus ochrogaster]|uniref:Protein DGCR6 n=1 Tax=Microtus ochrogaster TaxID=79684 RepID=A0A8J6G6Q3_MICOH|nr:Protein DGCR6 [Microtus ochrogaster]
MDRYAAAGDEAADRARQQERHYQLLSALQSLVKELPRQALRQKHLEAQQTCRPHNLPVLQAAQQRELEAMEHRIREEQQTMDRKIVLELDRKVADQQSTLEKAGVAGFYVTTNPQELTLQMKLLELIRKLQQRGCQVGKAAL